MIAKMRFFLCNKKKSNVQFATCSMHRQQWQQWHCNIKTETTCSSSYKRMSKGKHK